MSIIYIQHNFCGRTVIKADVDKSSLNKKHLTTPDQGTSVGVPDLYIMQRRNRPRNVGTYGTGERGQAFRNNTMVSKCYLIGLATFEPLVVFAREGVEARVGSGNSRDPIWG